MNTLDAVILAIVEGATEFLPVSSTGHMILVSELMGIENTEFHKSFEIYIQLGAIMAIVLLYSRRFLKDFNLYKKLLASFIPTAIIGLLFYDLIKAYLFNSLVVSLSLIIGGVILIFLDKKMDIRERKVEEVTAISYKSAVIIGLFQCISMIPGVSRAAATIIGGMVNGFDKKQAAEYSFLLAVPTMFAASVLDVIKSDVIFTSEELKLLAIGFVGAFIFALIFVLLMMKIIENFGFGLFGYYRIIVGVLFLLFVNGSI